MFEGVSLPFSVQELISSAMDLFALVDQYLLIGLAFVVWMFFNNLIFDVFEAYKFERELENRSDFKVYGSSQSKAQSLDRAWFKVTDRRGWRKSSKW
jgi:hypothetical protein